MFPPSESETSPVLTNQLPLEPFDPILEATTEQTTAATASAEDDNVGFLRRRIETLSRMNLSDEDR